jgi:hypothetical protein
MCAGPRRHEIRLVKFAVAPDEILGWANAQGACATAKNRQDI